MGAPLKLIESTIFLSGFKKLGKVRGAVKKLEALMAEVATHPESGKGHPKPLSGYGQRKVWSRHISEKHRLVYEIKPDGIVFISCYGHCDDR